MTATETLRHMLDERGVEWWQKKNHTCWKVRKGYETEMWRAWEDCLGLLTLKVDAIYDLTPEQAIAATLGPGTLSASQVSNAVYAHSIHADCADADWQAIADELNATLGPGTCKLTQASWDDGTCTWGCICSACDAHLEHETGIGYNFCPICGARVVRQ